jgi:L,D-peptidoglycan transpeptidase YkuD (ErfK/YbiS/YcfS/YnhG family)
MRVVLTAVLLGATLVACGSGGGPSPLAALAPTTTAAPPSASTTSPTVTAPTVGAPTVTAPTVTAFASATTGANTTAIPPATPSTTATLAPAPPPPATTVPADPLPSQLDQLGAASQAVVVTVASYGATTASLTAYERSGGTWRVAYGPWDAHVGYNGVAPPGEKREGDGRTPSGTYGFDFFFGVDPDPGVQFAYRRVTGTSIVWDDDPSSPLYNEWVDRTQQDPGADPEAMYQPTAYEYGAVIAYNSARTPALGSAIFLHASTGGPTAGCVSLPVSELLSVLRWLDPARQPRIVIGTG